MGEGGEGSSHEVYQAEVVHAPVTPGKPSGSDPNRVCKDWLGFNEAILEESSVKKSFSCSDGSLGSSSQLNEMSGGMHSKFLMDEMWNSISCRDLLALADANKRNGSGNGGNAAETQRKHHHACFVPFC